MAGFTIDEDISDLWFIQHLEINLLAESLVVLLSASETTVRIGSPLDMSLIKPPSFDGQLLVSSMEQVIQGADGDSTLRLPLGLDGAEAEAILVPLSFAAATRSTVGSPGVLAFDAAPDELAAISEENPLRLELTLDEEEDLQGVMPIAYDGEYYFLAGQIADPTTGSQDVNRRRLAFSITHLPLPVDWTANPDSRSGSEVSRNLKGTVRLFLYKVYRKELSPDTGIRKPRLNPDRTSIYDASGRPAYDGVTPADVVGAKRAALLVDGFTRDSGSALEEPVFALVGELADYDLMLVFDYDTFHTGIGENGALLAQELVALGFGPDDGVHLDIFCHGMGSQVVRAMVELEGGHTYTDRVFMAGAPNAGIRLAEGQKALFWASTILLNQAGLGPPSLIAKWFLDSSLENAAGIADLRPDSAFYQKLNSGTEPLGVQYFVQIGINTPPLGNIDWNRLFRQAGLADRFGQELDALLGPNDLLVSVSSARANGPHFNVDELAAEQAALTQVSPEQASPTPYRAIRNRLVDILLGYEQVGLFSGRNALLSHIPNSLTGSILRSEFSARLDVINIVEQMANIGQLDDGRYPLVIIIDTALELEEEGLLSQEMKAVRDDLIALYAKQATSGQLPSSDLSGTSPSAADVYSSIRSQTTVNLQDWQAQAEIKGNHFSYFWSDESLSQIRTWMADNPLPSAGKGGAVEEVTGQSVTWFVAWEETDGRVLRIGEECSFTLRFSRTQGSERLAVPLETQRLVVYLNPPPGLQLQSSRRVPISVSEGIVLLPKLEVTVAALLPGRYVLAAQIYPGRVFYGVAPVTVNLPISVAQPAPLDRIPEVLDRRVVPAPSPDMQLYVALEPTSDGGEQLRMYVTCPALEIDPIRQGKCTPLPLTRADVASLRQAVAHQASMSRRIPGRGGELALRRLGMALYDLLMPELPSDDNSLRDMWRGFVLLEGMTEKPLSLLIIADESVALPWELVLPYSYVEGEDGGLLREEEDFLAARFELSHWYGRQQLRMFNETPLRRMQIAHYGQHREELSRWRRALGGEKRVDVPATSEELLVADPNSDVVGLHLLRYADTRSGGLIASVDVATRDPKQVAAEERRLGFASRHPLVTISFLTGPGGDGQPGEDTYFESQWVLPLLKAEASALVGARWPTLPEIDQYFYRTFYATIRQGRRLGEAVRIARQAVRSAYLGTVDWLAYAYFGHPACEPYLVLSAQAYAVFEVVNQADDAPLLHGHIYQFRASYGAFAPDNYQGRVHLEQPLPPLTDPQVVIDARFLEDPDYHPLRSVREHVYEAIFSLRMPDSGRQMPVTAHFLDNEQILQSVILNLKLA